MDSPNIKKIKNSISNTHNMDIIQQGNIKTIKNTNKTDISNMIPSPTHESPRKARKNSDFNKKRGHPENDYSHKAKSLSDKEIRDESVEESSEVTIENQLNEEIDEILKEIYSTDVKNTETLLNFKNHIKTYIENKMFTPEMILEALINKLIAIMEENVINKQNSKKLIEILNKDKKMSLESGKGEKYFLNFWNKYKKDIDKVINELNQLYTILIQSSDDINLVFEFPIKLLENKKKKTKIDLAKFIKDKFFEVICNDELIKTLIHEIKKSQKENNSEGINILNDDLKTPNFKEILEICQANNSTCDDNENMCFVSEDDEEEKQVKKRRKPGKNKKKHNENSESNNKDFKDLNDLVKYINEDSDHQNKSKSMNVQASNSKKSKKNRKKIQNKINKDYFEEDEIISQFKSRLEFESKNSEEKEKIKPKFSRQFLRYINKALKEITI